MTPAETLQTRVRGEYAEMPCLRLTTKQAARFWRFDETLADQILTSLVQEEFLFRTRDGQFARETPCAHRA